MEERSELVSEGSLTMFTPTYTTQPQTRTNGYGEFDHGPMLDPLG